MEQKANERKKRFAVSVPLAVGGKTIFFYPLHLSICVAKTKCTVMDSYVKFDETL